MCYRPPAAEIAAAEAQGPKKKECSECGSEEKFTAKICSKCGFKFPPMKVAPKGPSAVPAPAAPGAPSAPKAPGAPQPPKAPQN